MESFIVRNDDRVFGFVDISAYFSRYRLPKLRFLRLSGCTISSWDLLKPQTTVLTTLELETNRLSPIPTPSQLLSILSSSPLLQSLSVFNTLAPHDGDSDRSAVRVQLRYLKQLYLSGNFERIFWLLNRLELPNKMDSLTLLLQECSPLCLSQTLGPYFGDHVGRRGRVPGGRLGLSATYNSRIFCLWAGDVPKVGDTVETVPFVKVFAIANVDLLDEESDRLCFGLISHIPWEQVTGLETAVPILRSEELCVKMRDLTHLHLVEADLSTWFAEPDIRKPHTFEERLCGLDHIVITKPL